VHVISDNYAGLVDALTGEEILAPNHFADGDLIFVIGSVRLVAVRDRSEYTSIGFGEWGVLCLNRMEMLTDFAYDSQMWYRDGMIVLRSWTIQKLFDVYSQQDIIPFGRFRHINPIGHGMASVAELSGEDASSALIEIATGYFIIDFGMFRHFYAISADEIRVTQDMEDGSRRTGTFSIAAMRATGLDVAWWDD